MENMPLLESEREFMGREVYLVTTLEMRCSRHQLWLTEGHGPVPVYPDLCRYSHLLL